MEQEKIQSAIESILFVSGEPVKKGKLLKILGVEKEVLESVLLELEAKYAKPESGLKILKNGEEIQLVSNPENGLLVENLVKGEMQEALSNSAMEVVSIIAYRGPISKPEIEQIRGVNCAYTLRNLSLRGLISRNENPRDQRGYVYTVSFDFLKKMGIDEVKKLPDYATLSVDERVKLEELNEIK